MSKAQPQVLVYFDGVCGLCNRFVDFLIRRDRNHVLRFAPLQGKSAAAALPKNFIVEPDTIVLLENGVLYFRSAAVMRTLGLLGGIHRLALIGFLMPAALRDFFYQIAARNRYRLFGKKDACRIPSPEEKKWFVE